MGDFWVLIGTILIVFLTVPFMVTDLWKSRVPIKMEVAVFCGYSSSIAVIILSSFAIDSIGLFNSQL